MRHTGDVKEFAKQQSKIKIFINNNNNKYYYYFSVCMGGL